MKGNYRSDIFWGLECHLLIGRRWNRGSQNQKLLGCRHQAENGHRGRIVSDSVKLPQTHTGWGRGRNQYRSEYRASLSIYRSQAVDSTMGLQDRLGSFERENADTSKENLWEIKVCLSELLDIYIVRGAPMKSPMPCLQLGLSRL